jgi:hypothetical protein
MTDNTPNGQIGDNHSYNCPHDSDDVRAAGPGKIEVIIPAAQLQEFGASAGRALLHLLVEAHHKRTMKNEQSTEDT